MTRNRPTHLVVDGSNIATEGRSAPSLEQLDEAVRAILEEFPHERLTVVVDATFGHRIADSERAAYEEAILAGEIVAPPAGAVGRGDAFILQVADKANATVFSNDSFQEFHGQHEWLFDEGRLIGGKPVPGVGWVFVNRVPVRGPASRRSMRQTKRSGGSTPSRSPAPDAAKAVEEETRARRSRRAAPPRGARIGDTASIDTGPTDTKRAEPATAEERPNQSVRAAATASSDGGDRSPQEALNDPHVFLSFIAENRIGSVLEATVDHFSSHGAYVIADGARCYLPTKTMGDPPPNRARDVVDRGDVVRVEVQSLDAQRRGINVRFVDVVDKAAPTQLDGAETDQTVETPLPLRSGDEAEATAHLRSGSDVATRTSAAKKSAAKKAPSGRTATKAASKKAATKKSTAEATPSPRAVKAAAKKAPSTRATAAKKAPAKKSTATKATSTKAAGTKKATAKKAPAAKKAVATKATAKRAAATKTTAKKAAATKTTAKKAATKKATAKKAARTSR